MESGNENAHRLVSGCTIREEGLGVVKDLRTWSFRSVVAQPIQQRSLCELDGNISTILCRDAVLSKL